MTTLTYSQIKSIAANKGFTGNDLNIAVAVAMAESGGDPNCHNSVRPDDSYGLWQINMLDSMGPDRRAALHLKTNEQLFVPAINAEAAMMIWKSQGWQRGWTTYASGKYKKFLPEATKAAVVPITDPSVSQLLTMLPGGNIVGDAAKAVGVGGAVVDAVKNPLDAIPAAFNSLGENIFKSVSNIGGLVVAMVLLGIGATILITTSKTGKSAIAGGKKAAKLAAVVA